MAKHDSYDKNGKELKEQEEEETPESEIDKQSKAGEEAEEDKPVRPIIILEERDIPFEEERPPNFTPHFHVKVNRVHRHEKPRVVTE